VGLAVALVTPIPPDHALTESRSPDGEYIAKFSWRPAGFLGLVTKENPWVYMTIVQSSTDKVVERHRAWGDVPSDACERLGSLAPWHIAISAENCHE
jgi:hypothetical protein